MGIAHLARPGSILCLLLAVVACSSTTAPSPTVVTSSAGQATPSSIPTTIPTASPTPSLTPSPRPMAPAAIEFGPAMALAREGQAAVRLDDGRVLFLGGTVPFTGKCEMACVPPATASVEIYDPSTGKFSPNGSLAEPRTDGAALLLDDGRVLVSGGSSEFGWRSTLEIYDPAKRTSVVVKPPATQELPIYPTAVLLADGRVLIAGGSYDLLNTTSKVTLIFDPASGRFSNGPLMARARQGATAKLLHDGRVLIGGGDYYEGYYGYANYDAELIDPSNPLSSSTLLVSQGSPSSSTLLSDGRVLVAGRGTFDAGAGCLIPVVSEVFDPRTESLTPAGPMSTQRTGSAAVKIQDGRVLFLGGLDTKCAPAGTVEAFDPGSGTFQVIATGFPKISDFSATLLDDGEILIAGGYSDVDGIAGASWLLKP